MTRVEVVYRLANRAGLMMMRALRLDVRWTGAEHVPTRGPVILAANHVGFPDFIVVQRAVLERGRLVRFLTRYDVWSVPGVGLAMDRMGHIPVDRAVPAHAYLLARRVLREGEAVGVFPEAGISHSFTVRPLMRGAVALARETGAPVVPVAVWGTQRILTAGQRVPDLARGRRVDLSFGPPLHVGAGDDLTARTHELGRRLTEQLEALQRLPEHQPRPGEVASWHPAHLGGHAPDRREARALDAVPRSAVTPSWGPGVPAGPGGGG